MILNIPLDYPLSPPSLILRNFDLIGRYQNVAPDGRVMVNLLNVWNPQLPAPLTRVLYEVKFMFSKITVCCYINK
jgi:ubiquitin-protein ligase